ncbi:hypothetical protein T484DRAFT_1809477, partial [Baffinella frigidus]
VPLTEEQVFRRRRLSSCVSLSFSLDGGSSQEGVHVAGGNFGNGTDGPAHDAFAGDDDTQPVVGESSQREKFSQKLLSEVPPEQLTLREIDDELTSRKIDDEVKAEIGNAMHVHKSYYNRHLTYMVVISLILGLCVVSVAIPSRFIPKIVNLGPSTDLSEYREASWWRMQALVKACVHLSRELVLDDGFSRMTAPQIAGTLNHALTLLHDVDLATMHSAPKGAARGGKD